MASSEPGSLAVLSRAPLAEPSPDSAPGQQDQAQGQGQSSDGTPSGGIEAGTSNNGGRKRIRRACDKCSKSRTRCDGDFPCLHCTNYGFTCSYDREQRPRGRASSKRMRVFDSHSPTLNDTHATGNAPKNPGNNPDPPFATNGAAARPSINSEIRQPHSGTDAGQRDPPNHSVDQQESSSSTSFNPPMLHNPRPDYQNFDFLQIHQDVIGAPNFQSFYFDDPSLNSLSHLDYYGNAIPAIPATIYSTAAIGAEASSPNDADVRRSNGTPRDRPRTMSRIGFVVPGTPQFRPQSAFGKPNETPPTCRYPVLAPLLQYISHIISPTIACQLLDLYFAEPSSSLFESASPFVLTHIFRKQSFLHPTKPRKTSPALLAAMLWATAQTSDASIFKTAPTSRARVCDRLFAVCLRLLNPLLHETPRRASLDHLPIPERSHSGNVRDGMHATGTLDDVLTLTLIGIVISGGDFKHDCKKWWRATWALAKELKLGQEVDETVPSTPEPPSEVDSSTPPNTPLSEEEKEERRRTWWLLFIADRHLALSFNDPLHIFEAECHLYQPLDDATWQETEPESLKERYFGPSTTCTGTGLFEFFLPLMVILGDIVDIHHRRYHPRFGAIENNAAIASVEALLETYEQSLKILEPPSNSNPPSRYSNQNGDFQTRRLPSIHQINNSPFSLPLSPPNIPPKATSSTSPTRKAIVHAYSTHILHVLHILLHGPWDPISMLDDVHSFTSSPAFQKCANHSILAAEAVNQILFQDPELSFMPYLWGIYLLHGSFILLCFADRMVEGNARGACEVLVRAHEVCVATLNTEYQRNFRKVLRSALYDARGIISIDTEDQRAKRREFLSLYRWANNGVGLAL